MSPFKQILLCAAALLSAVANFLGIVIVLTSLQNGSISSSYAIGGSDVDETVTRTGDAARFWRLLAAMGIAPAAIGAAALWCSVLTLRAGA